MIYVIDDDPSVRAALTRLMTSADLLVCSFAAGEAFLTASQPTASDCLVIDVQMPGMSGLDVQQRVAQTGRGVSLIFMTAIDDEQARDQVWRAGAVAYFRKPLDGPALLDTIAFALCRTIS